MIESFRGDEGFKRLVKEILKQKIVYDDEELADALAQSCFLFNHAPNSTIISHDGTDNDFCLIISGQVSIQINGKEIAKRVSGEYVGEMAVIDPTCLRSADVVSIDEVIVARVTELAFSSLADKYPRLWRVLAVDLGDKLRKLTASVPAQN
ncbi:MAG: cyclic nucleotide-binding domain-containing protein [Nitrosomonadaceae bacterium]